MRQQNFAKSGRCLEPGPALRGEDISEPCPPNLLLVAPQTRNVPPKRGLCPKESNKLRATGMQFGVWDLEILIINQVFMDKNRFFAMKTFFYFVFWFTQILRRRPFFSVCTPEFVEICAYFVKKTFLCFGPHSRIGGKYVFVPPQKLFMLPQSRHSGSGTALNQMHYFLFQTNI